MDFIVFFFTRVALREMSVYFAILISKSVSRGTVVFFVSILLLFTQLLYFIWKLVILITIDRENVVFCKPLCSLNIKLRRRFLKIAKTGK